MSKKDRKETESDVGVATKERVRTKEPKQYKVILLNDDFTTMDFVVAVLETIFKKTPAEAVQIMLHVHQKGRGVAGIYPKEIAEAKMEEVRISAEAKGHPLQCTLEEA